MQIDNDTHSSLVLVNVLDGSPITETECALCNYSEEPELVEPARWSYCVRKWAAKHAS